MAQIKNSVGHNSIIRKIELGFFKQKNGHLKNFRKSKQIGKRVPLKQISHLSFNLIKININLTILL